MIAAGDALGELPQFIAIQQIAQFGLTDQDDLQQLLGVGLQIGEQPHLFEHLGREVLRLIDTSTTRLPRCGHAAGTG